MSRTLAALLFLFLAAVIVTSAAPHVNNWLLNRSLHVDGNGPVPPIPHVSLWADGNGPVPPIPHVSMWADGNGPVPPIPHVSIWSDGNGPVPPIPHLDA